ncbi:hypothetical protein [Paracoccus litorisediminis]|uniref:Uncharacterized protein n=1 Tax=Paracoccus litorisediminis TaxID=2006130 RepID=A0A844HS66_9RHOB|nr:hypothetical protein [Paracoccus litorisediminis]MTH61177.1 hypothetical protein [Paracoccus litorisediminis]
MSKLTYTAKTIDALFDNRVAMMAEKADTKAENFKLMQTCRDYMKTAAFLETARLGKVDLHVIDGSAGRKPMAVYAIKRVVDMCRFADSGFEATVTATDQTRYARDMLLSLMNSRATGKQFARLDQRATGSKGQSRDTADGYAEGAISQGVKVSGRMMAAGTTGTQTTNTLAIFKFLNCADDNGQRGAGFRWYAKPDSELLNAYANKMAAVIAKQA